MPIMLSTERGERTKGIGASSSRASPRATAASSSFEAGQYRFRRFCATDVHDVRALQASRLYEFLLLSADTFVPSTDDEVRRKIACWNDVSKLHPGLGYWRVSDRATDALMGKVFLVPFGSSRIVQFGGVMLSAHWGRRHAFEGTMLFLEHAFDTLKLPYLTTLMLGANRPASALADALGFVTVLDREHAGVALRAHYLSADDWRARRAATAAATRVGALRTWLRRSRSAPIDARSLSLPPEVRAMFGVKSATATGTPNAASS